MRSPLRWLEDPTLRNLVRLAAAAVSALGFSLSAHALTPQTITFPALANTPFTSAPPTPAATASSGLPVSYVSNSTGVCTIAGSTISFVSAGTCSITASQAGNANYAAATPVTRTFNVTKGVNTISFPALPDTPLTSSPPTPAATASSGLPVSYASTTTGVCKISGSTISFVSAGTCSIKATQAGNATYAAATAVTQSFSVTPGVNTIAFPALANTPFTSPPPAPAATASSGPPGQRARRGGAAQPGRPAGPRVPGGIFGGVPGGVTHGGPPVRDRPGRVPGRLGRPGGAHRPGRARGHPGRGPAVRPDRF